MAEREGSIEAELRELESDPNKTMGPMYEGWAPSQREVRAQKPGSGTVTVPVEREGDLADEQLREHLRDLARIVAEPGMTEAEALKNFFETIIKGGESPADHGSEAPEFEGGEREAQVYGRRAAMAAKEREHEEEEEEHKESKAAEHEEEEEEEEERKRERKAIVSALRKIDARLAALESRSTPAATPSARSVESGRPGASATPTGKSDGVLRRGQANGASTSQLFGIEVVKLLAAAKGYGERQSLQRESSDVVTALQLGVRPTINNPQLQGIAHNLGIEFESASGAFITGRGE